MDNRIKVFYLIERLARAGTELSLLKILQQLDRSRFAPVLCCLNDAMTDRSLLPPDVKYHGLQGSWNLATPATWFLYRRLCRLIASEKPDLVHTFLFVSNFLGPFAARKARVGGVVSSRGRMGIDWQAGSLHRMAQRASDRRTDLILCKTEAIAREIAEVENMPLDRIRVVPNGVDTERFAPVPDHASQARREHLAARHGVPADGPLVVAVGNLKPIKGHKILVEAAALLHRQRSSLRMAIVGKGESEADLREAVKSLALEQHVFLPGAADDVLPWLQAADLFVAPSLSEGMPNAVLEAMATGLPVVLSDIAGHRETALDAASYFAAENAADLARVVEDAFADESGRKEKASQGVERVRAKFSLSGMVGTVESIYEEILGVTDREAEQTA